MPARKKAKLNDQSVKEQTDATAGLVGREREFSLLMSRLEKALGERTPASLYVCGRPGTGKTFTVMEVVNELKRRKGLRRDLGQILITNGMAYATEKDLYSDLARHLEISTSGKSLKQLESEVHSSFSSSSRSPMLLLVIDEIDKLVSGARAGLIESLFRIPFLENSKVVLVTIANAVDLTERLLARIKQREIRPEVILFETYTEQQIRDIIDVRMKGVDIEEMALTFCAKKVAQTSGDIRAALDLLESARSENVISFSSITQLASQFFVTPIGKVIRGLPFQMQMVLNTLTLSQCNSQISVREAYAAHGRRCREKRWDTMSSSDFFEALNTLDIYSLARITQPKGVSEMREAEVEILVTREELLKAFEGLPHIEAALGDRE